MKAGIIWVGVVLWKSALLGADLSSALPLNAKKATIPIVLSGQNHASALLRIEKIFPEYPRKGFFRLGLMPTTVAEGVVVELRDRARFEQILATLSDQLSPEPGRGMEWRRVQCSFSDEKISCFEAGKIRFEGVSWALSQGVRIRSGTNRIEVSQARLRVKGPGAGEVTWRKGDRTNCWQIFGINDSRKSGEQGKANE